MLRRIAATIVEDEEESMNRIRVHRMAILIGAAIILAACGAPDSSPPVTEQTAPTADHAPLSLTVHGVAGEAEIRSSGASAFSAAASGQALGVGDGIRTSGEVWLALTLPSAGTLILGPETLVTVAELPGEGQREYRFVLTSGEAVVAEPPGLGAPGADSNERFVVTFDIALQSERATVSVAGGEADGSRLASVTLDAISGSLSASCHAGACLVSLDGHETVIPTGEVAVLEKGAGQTLRYKWSRDNGTVVTALAAAGIEPEAFHLLEAGAGERGEELQAATVHRVEGATLTGDGLNAHEAAAGETLTEGHSLHTDEGARASIHLNDGAVVQVGEHSTLHLEGALGQAEDSKVHLALEAGELYILHAGEEDRAHTWVVEVPGGVQVHVRPDEETGKVALHVSYDAESDEMEVTLLAGEAELRAGDQSADVALRKRTEVRDSHDRYANIETNMTVSEPEEDEVEEWGEALEFAEIPPEEFDLGEGD
jgi:hypothetical protein